MNIESATEKQVAFIEKLTGILGGDRPYNFATMTKSQASQIIDELKAEIDFVMPAGLDDDQLGYD